MAKTIVIGDIHGCYDELTALLEKVGLGAEDRVIGVGDLTVKGPKNKDVLDLFMKDSRFSSVLGNHDRALLKYWKGLTQSLKSSQQRAYDELQTGGVQYFEFLGTLPYLIELGSYVVVHAGLRPGVPKEHQSEEDLTELRTLGPDRTNRDGIPWYDEYSGPQTVLFGHWPAAEPRRGKFALGLDTGCVYGYDLTAYVIEPAELISVKAKKAYSAPSR
jgi:hypothetical protein